MIILQERRNRKMPDGFNTYETGSPSWIVYHDHGTTYVHAPSEAIALARFMAKYPERKVRKIVRA